MTLSFLLKTYRTKTSSWGLSGVLRTDHGARRGAETPCDQCDERIMNFSPQITDLPVPGPRTYILSDAPLAPTSPFLPPRTYSFCSHGRLNGIRLIF